MERSKKDQKCTILYVDDEELALTYFSELFGEHFRILTAPNAAEGYRLLEKHRDEIAVIITDQRMPGENGVQFLERARRFHPTAIRILATGYADLNVVIEAVNSGAIYKYLMKPWDVRQLEATLTQACEIYLLQRQRDLLLREKLSALQKMINERVQNSEVLASRLGHHVRNSLVTVQTFLDLLPEKLEEERVDMEQLRNLNFWKGFYEQSRAEIWRITELLTDVVIAAETTDSPLLGEAQLGQILERSLEKLRPHWSEKRITVANRIPPSLPAPLVEPQKFQCLFDLLLKDEISRLPAGSRIYVSARLQSGNIEEVEIELKDNGPKWPEETLRSLFDPVPPRPMTTQKFEVNLMACHLIVSHHGGRIEVRNAEDRGVIFTLAIPVHPKTSSQAEREKDLLTTIMLHDTLWEKILGNRS